jgi:DNA-directed RNA polymerase
MPSEAESASPEGSGITSTLGDAELQLQREQREERRSREAQAATEAKLRAARRESRLAHGRQLLRIWARPVAMGLNDLAAVQLVAPTAGVGRAGLNLLPLFRRPEHAALIALRVIVDRLTGGDKHTTLAGVIGMALEQELRGQKMAAAKPTLFRQLKRHHEKRSHLTRRKIQEHLCGAGSAEPWTNVQKHEIGALMLHLVAQHTELIEIRIERVGGRPVRMVRPTEAAMNLVREVAPGRWSTARGAMACPPRPWRGLTGGGSLSGKARLVRSRAGNIDHLKGADLGRALEVVNHLQSRQLEIDHELVAVAREAWSAGGLGLFKVASRPLPLPLLPHPKALEEAFIRHRREVAQHHADLRENAGRRMRIERGLSALEQTPTPCWFAHDLDDRGRVYTVNRVASHQGQDYEKAAVSFRGGEQLDVDGFEWLLWGMAGHWGTGRAGWAERVAWGMRHLEMAVAVADAPLDQLDLWQDAKDPWQFLQAARAVASWLDDPSRPIGCPVRMDQTTSGCGIIAALLRDRWLGRECNLWGDTGHDLYETIALEVQEEVRRHQHGPTRWGHRMACLWMEHGIDRKLLKGPVLALPYGGMFQGVVDGLCLAREERVGWLPLHEYDDQVAKASVWLAKIIQAVMRERLATPIAFCDWTRRLAKMVITQQQPLEWTGPMGWPMRQGRPTPTMHRLKTELFGLQTMQMDVQEEVPDGELSLRQTRISLPANMIHSFDAALCHAIVCSAAAHGAPLLTNHDCFATTAGRAGWLRQQLLTEMREMHQTPWLSVITKEVSRRSGIQGLPKPPVTGDLSPGLIGSNPALFS